VKNKILTKEEVLEISSEITKIGDRIDCLDGSIPHENDELSILISKLDEYESMLTNSLKLKRSNTQLRIVK
jgi:hypothetical protein